MLLAGTDLQMCKVVEPTICDLAALSNTKITETGEAGAEELQTHVCD